MKLTEAQVRSQNTELAEHLRDYFENEWSKSNQTADCTSLRLEDTHVSFYLKMQVGGALRTFKIEIS